MQRSEIEEATVDNSDVSHKKLCKRDAAQRNRGITVDILMIVEPPCVYTRDILDSHPGSRSLWHVAW